MLAPAALKAVLGAAVIAAAPVAAGADGMGPRFAQPIDCMLGDTCFILNLPDTDPGDGVADYTCGPRSYDTHKGTDFALPSYAAMGDGVDVLAAAPGRVKAIRDGMRDVGFGSNNAPDVTGRECGNGVVIDHGGGWESQYCHLANGSITVQTGDKLRMGQVIGTVGLSGKTQYPHVHFSLRKNGRVVDPFHPDAQASCLTEESTEDQLWLTPLPYPAGGIVSAGFSPNVPSFDAIKQGNAASEPMPKDGPALVGWNMIYGPRVGDILRLRIEGPNGVVAEQDITMEKTQVLAFRAFGKKTRSPWPAGIYTLRSWMIRKGKVLDGYVVETTIP